MFATSYGVRKSWSIEAITGVHESELFNTLTIADPKNAAETLDGLVIRTDATKSSPAAAYSVRDGQFIDIQTKKAVDPQSLKGKEFEIIPMS
jgi:hypothetical protein